MQITEQLIVELSARLKRTDGESAILNAAHALIKERASWMSDSNALGPATELRDALLERAAVLATGLGDDTPGDLLTRSTAQQRAWDALTFLGVRSPNELRKHVDGVMKRAAAIRRGENGKVLQPFPSTLPQSRSVREVLRKARTSEKANVERIARKMVADPIGNLPPPGSGWQHD